MLLAQRSIFGYEAAKDFFRPDLNKLHDPFLMKDMTIAVKRISKLLKIKKRFWFMAIMM